MKSTEAGFVHDLVRRQPARQRGQQCRRQIDQEDRTPAEGMGQKPPATGPNILEATTTVAIYP